MRVLEPAAAAPEAAPKLEVAAKPSKPVIGGSGRPRPATPSTSSQRPTTAPVRTYGGREPQLEWYNRLSSSTVQQVLAEAAGSGPPSNTSKKRELPMLPGSAREPHGPSPHTRRGQSTPGAARPVTRVAPIEVG